MNVDAVRGPISLLDDLSEYKSQFEAIKKQSENLLAGLSDVQFNWKPASNKWSIADCIDHLIVTGRLSIAHIYHAISNARSQGLFSRGPFRYGLLERWFVRAMEPPPGIKFKAPKAYIPSRDRACAELAMSFLRLQDEFLLCIREANGIDLARAKVKNPVSRIVRLSLGQELALNAAHERRHLWQARQITGCNGFPLS